MKRVTNLLIVALLIITVLSLPKVFALQGYSYTGLHWNISPGQTITYYIYQGGSPDIPDDSEITAIQTSFQTWENDVGSYVDFTYSGLTSSRGDNHYDGRNVVDFINLGPSDIKYHN
ncbi:MAG: hypothetical protein ACUVTD_04055 [Nitrososphaerales archaeon]